MHSSNSSTLRETAACPLLVVAVDESMLCNISAAAAGCPDVLHTSSAGARVSANWCRHVQPIGAGDVWTVAHEGATAVCAQLLLRLLSRVLGECYLGRK
jgi:hypothetical protein